MNIKEVSKKTNTSENTIRYYERMGLIPVIKRTNAGIRWFDEEDLKWILFVKQMMEVNLSIEGLIDYATLVVQDNATDQARIEILTEQKMQLQEQIVLLEKAKLRIDCELEKQHNETNKLSDN
ncbi:MAG: MerR family transcriptional regulator [Carnobacterium sp.]|uniref:MerR family transcriptional regulator n=1 Tax=Carnobacterium TaxID=2747 RepID=UPI00257F987C|nr:MULTISPECIES: MerR family transcriptional regulator [Carnobacterium]MBQ6484530.1 MerR family transcriptional regulator [Carnobacterium sp.]MDW5522518.1 MerR family transcriptional regulator [Carnobacterium maltaromaticum]